MTTEIEWAWLAGFFDGEGCVRGRSYWRHDKAKPRHSVAISLVITQRDREVLDRIQAMTGVGTVTSKTGTPTPAFHWVTGGHTQLAGVLEHLIPYSVVKRDQMLLAIELIKRCNLRGGRGSTLSPEEIETRIEMLRKLSSLKRHHLPVSFADGSEKESLTR